ncbi:MAG: hypothetical protein MI863_28945 [Desulfobacterales bacterium]|nr:hypothetical protein [Desulfobacterales bacterium]
MARSNPLYMPVGLIFVISVILAGCASIKPATDPAEDKRAEAMAQKARDFNKGITTSKGTGWMVLDTGSQKQRFKMAWAAEAPNRLRLTLLMAGHPVETIAASGDWVTFISHTGKHKPHSAVSTDPDLTPYINIPVRLSEMISILLGRVPVRPFDKAWVSPENPDKVLASKNFSGTIQSIIIDGQGRVVRYRLTKTDMTPVYYITYNKFRPAKGYLVPASLTIGDRAGRTLDITLSGMVPNAPVKESVFRLTGAGS